MNTSSKAAKPEQQRPCGGKCIFGWLSVFLIKTDPFQLAFSDLTTMLITKYDFVSRKVVILYKIKKQKVMFCKSPYI